MTKVRKPAASIRFARPAGAVGGTEDGVLEPLKDGLRTGGAIRAEFVAANGLAEAERQATQVSRDQGQVHANRRAADLPERRDIG